MDVEPLVTWLRDTATRFTTLERGRVEALRAQAMLQSQLDELRQDHAALSAQVEQQAALLRRPPCSPDSPRRPSPRKASVAGGGALSCSSLSPCSSKASLSDMSGFHCARLSFASSTHTEWERERESRRSLSPRKAPLELVDENQMMPLIETVAASLEPLPCDPVTPVRPAEPDSDFSPLQTTVRRMPLSPDSRAEGSQDRSQDHSQDRSQDTLQARPGPLESASTAASTPASACGTPASALGEAPAEGSVMAAYVAAVAERTSISPEVRRVSQVASPEPAKDGFAGIVRGRPTSSQPRKVATGAWNGPQHTAARNMERAISAERAISERRESPRSMTALDKAVEKVTGSAPRSFAAAAEASKRVMERAVPARTVRSDRGSDLGGEMEPPRSDTPCSDSTNRTEMTFHSHTKEEAATPAPEALVEAYTQEAKADAEEHDEARHARSEPAAEKPRQLLSPSVSPEKPRTVIAGGPAHARTFEDDVAACQEWVELVTKRTFAMSFADELTSGELLCELAIAICPSSVRRYNKVPKTPFKRLENLSTFIQACRSFGVMEYELFSTSDVESGRGLAGVTRCLFALGRAIQTTCPTFTGPHLGNPDNSKRKLMRTTSGNLMAVSSPVPCVPQTWTGVQRVTVDSNTLDRGKWGRQASASPAAR